MDLSVHAPVNSDVRLLNDIVQMNVFLGPHGLNLAWCNKKKSIHSSRYIAEAIAHGLACARPLHGNCIGLYRGGSGRLGDGSVCDDCRRSGRVLSVAPRDFCSVSESPSDG